MNYLRERAAYLKGLADGMQLDTSTNEGKLLKAILDVVDDIALAVDDIVEVQTQLSEQVDEIDEDLAEIESLLYDLDDDDDGYYDDDEEEIVAELDCPHCDETVNLEDAFMKGIRSSVLIAAKVLKSNSAVIVKTVRMTKKILWTEALLYY